jgi:electron transport complex protein RnfA
MGIAVIAVRQNYNAMESFVAGISVGLGFLLAIFIMATLREKLELEDVPQPFKGVPVAFITAGLMAMSFMAFDQALLNNILGG